MYELSNNRHIITICILSFNVPVIAGMIHNEIIIMCFICYNEFIILSNNDNIITNNINTIAINIIASLFFQ